MAMLASTASPTFFAAAARPQVRPSGGRRVVCNAMADRQMWLPGSEAPAHLKGTLPGDFGFDPLNLAKEPALLARFREAEVLHGRWAMLGITGLVTAEAMGYPNYIQVGKAAAVDGPSYLGQALPYNLAAVAIFQFVAMAFVEFQRKGETDAEKRIYPGGSFDPMGLASEKRKVAEIKNGRLAMMAVLGVFTAGQTSGKGPWELLQLHLADPFHNTVGLFGGLAQ